MADQELDNKTSAEPKTEAEPSSLFFKEKCKEVVQEVNLKGGDPEKMSVQNEAVDAVVHKVSDEVGLNTRLSEAKTPDEVQRERGKLYEEVSSEVKDTFGLGAVGQEMDAKVAAWKSENINSILEAKARQDREEEKKNIPDTKEEKTIIDLIIDKVLQLLGLSQPQENPSQAKKSNSKGKESKADTRKPDKEPFLLRLLRAIGLLE